MEFCILQYKETVAVHVIFRTSHIETPTILVVCSYKLYPKFLLESLLFHFQLEKSTYLYHNFGSNNVHGSHNCCSIHYAWFSFPAPFQLRTAMGTALDNDMWAVTCVIYGLKHFWAGPTCDPLYFIFSASDQQYCRKRLLCQPWSQNEND